MLRLFIQIVIPVVLVTFAIYALTRKKSRKQIRQRPGPESASDDEQAVEVQDAGPISVPAFLTIVAMGALFSLGLVAVLA